MELKEVIKNRRSIRKFDTKKIDKSIIEEILYYGSLAPSGKNICLTATDIGIGSLWICDIDCAFSEVEKLLKKENSSLVGGGRRKTHFGEI